MVYFIKGVWCDALWWPKLLHPASTPQLINTVETTIKIHKHNDTEINNNKKGKHKLNLLYITAHFVRILVKSSNIDMKKQENKSESNLFGSLRRVTVLLLLLSV